MKIEVLLSCMNQKDFSLIDKMNITTDILIVNQCNENKYEERIINGKKQRMIYTTQRGLSQSRNELLNNMEGDIGVLCDDDVVYTCDYESKIKEAYLKLKNADMIIFNIEMINSQERVREIKKIGKISKHRNYCSVRITFKKQSLYKNNLWFNRNFGSGAKYFSGEESLLLREAKKRKLNIYEYPKKILKVDCSKSSWFTGYNKDFFLTKGAWLKAAYPNTFFIFKWYYIFKFGKNNLRKIFKINRYLNLGIIEYSEYMKKGN